MPHASKFKPHNVPCPVPNCWKLCMSWKGLSNHLRTHCEKLRNMGLQGPLQCNIPNPMPNRVNIEDPITPNYDYNDDDNGMHQDIQQDARLPSPPQQAPNTAENSEKAHIHPVINGTSVILVHLHLQFYHTIRLSLWWNWSISARQCSTAPLEWSVSHWLCPIRISRSFWTCRFAISMSEATTRSNWPFNANLGSYLTKGPRSTFLQS